LTFLFDENIPQGIVVALRALNHDVTHVYEQGLRSTPDPEIFAAVAERGWVLVTRDKKIRRKPHERAAYLATGIGVFIYTGSAERTLDEQMLHVLRTMPEMERIAARARPPYLYGISDQGKMERLP
jgi:predicted nuclease of predicted toxin-antitoxin system